MNTRHDRDDSCHGISMLIHVGHACREKWHADCDGHGWCKAAERAVPCSCSCHIDRPRPRADITKNDLEAIKRTLAADCST